MSAAKVIMPEEYNQLLTARSKVNFFREVSGDAQTIIIDKIPTNGNLYIWIVNYVINAVRMMVPIELLIKGYKYIPFVVYQILVTVYLIKAFANLKSNKNNAAILSLCVFCAYLLTSFMFEPDFGSWVRHESATFPIFINLVFLKKS